MVEHDVQDYQDLKKEKYRLFVQRSDLECDSIFHHHSF
jgi:hypothetical protein